ncbi:splicing factor U2af small subunit B-like [Histomonas meleagridis]|uniref:splicing factor U2af small subunit B-like n=1 Tax=Histomonas meleagridis TaxID=135588 RepID=UPI003559CF07|nr:splicing factor U2af small subunit B-like [Histomonas meleagridis]KAH0803650.1 splicing factor U2af small subunit B-like [Histomonas meleagridis]
MHIRPQASKTLLLCNLYPNPIRFISLLPKGVLEISNSTLDRNFDEFYIDIYEELRTFGPIEDLLVASNLCDHLVGNVLVRYENLEDAVSAFSNLRCCYYAGRPIDAQYSPVDVFSGAICRQFHLGKCQHGENCNFIHPKYPSSEVLEHCILTKDSNSTESPRQRNSYSSDNDENYHQRQREKSDRSRTPHREYDRSLSREYERSSSRRDYERKHERSFNDHDKKSSRDRERSKSRDYERSSGRDYERDYEKSSFRNRRRSPSPRDYDRPSRQRGYERQRRY